MSAVTKTSPRILILGGSGMLGHKLWQRFSRRFSEVKVTLRRPVDAYASMTSLFDSPNVIGGVDAKDWAGLSSVLRKHRPEVILNAIGITKRHESEGSEAEMIELNSKLPHRLAEWAGENGSKLIHFSTDCVFSGERGGYEEEDATDAKDRYGQTKAQGEVRGPHALTLRTSFVGRELHSFTELFEWFLAQKGKKVKGYRNAIYSGLSTETAVKVVGDLVESGTPLTGLLNMASEPITKLDLLRAWNEAFSLGITIEPEENFRCRRNLDAKLWAKQTGIRIPAWSEMIAAMKADETPYESWRKK